MAHTIEDEPQTLVLTSNDKVSATWQKLVVYFENELKKCRGKNDDLKLTEIQTAVLRGRIATLKSFIALGDTSPVLGD